MAHHSELAQFISAATVALDSAFSKGDQANYSRNWENQDDDIHLNHARAHISEMLLAESDLDSAIFRLLAVKVLRLRRQMENE